LSLYKGAVNGVVWNAGPRSRGERLLDKAPAVVDPVEGDEAAHSRALRGAEEGLVQCLEPGAEIVLAEMGLADFEDEMLDCLRVGSAWQVCKL
jgi:hypothetical protein